MLPSDSCEVGAQKDHMPQPRAPEAAKPKESETESSTCPTALFQGCVVTPVSWPLGAGLGLVGTALSRR